MKRLLILGAGSNGKVVAEAAIFANQWGVTAFLAFSNFSSKELDI